IPAGGIQEADQGGELRDGVRGTDVAYAAGAADAEGDEDGVAGDAHCGLHSGAAAAADNETISCNELQRSGHLEENWDKQDLKTNKNETDKLVNRESWRSLLDVAAGSDCGILNSIIKMKVKGESFNRFLDNEIMLIEKKAGQVLNAALIHLEEAKVNFCQNELDENLINKTRMNDYTEKVDEKLSMKTGQSHDITSDQLQIVVGGLDADGQAGLNLDEPSEGEGPKQGAWKMQGRGRG
ncbi:hypothetical protein, partial [Litorimonas sp.]|uniref:hypothetical protein n=1 Tax=Litorimonas sp. TaxID=1892381 RepID=UPI003A88FB8C